MRVLTVDVGSGSVRAAIIEFVDDNLNGTPIATSSKNITIYNPKPDYYEQKTHEIWNAVCHCIKECVKSDQMVGHEISGIGFSATCSLVIVENCTENDVIMWMDHRAVEEAKLITATQHAVIEQFGGTCSPEFSLSKLLWMKKHEPLRFENAIGFMELPDWLSWRCSTFFNSNSVKTFPRSICSVVCKWGFDAEKHKWRDDLFQLIGLNEFVSDKSKIGEKIVAPASCIGMLSSEAASSFGLTSAQISIASPLIDAHAGVLAMIALFEHPEKLSSDEKCETTFCMIAGTSTCDMISTKDRQFTKGVWGPYFNAIFPGYYTREAGQSATGKLIEHVIRSHPDWETLKNQTEIEDLIQKLNEEILSRNQLNKLHVNPCFHGNRSPLANFSLKGGVYGLSLEKTSLIDWYEATIEALAYESKFILEELKINNLKSILITGGLTKNNIYMQIHADVFNTEVFTFSLGEADLMLVGAAILAHQAANGLDLTASQIKIKYPNLKLEYYKPRSQLQKYHDLKYRCYRDLLNCALKIEQIMDQL